MENKDIVDKETLKDDYMSGKYLVVSVAHVCNNDSHVMSLKIKRDSMKKWKHLLE